MLPYTVLASFYDKIIRDENYVNWVNYVVSLVSKNAVKKVGLDVACGSGISTISLKKQGFKVTGVDVSEEMLIKARENALTEKLNIEFLRQDMKFLKTFEKVGFITVINDGINYLKQRELLSTFKNFYKALEVNGVLIFDVSSSYKLKTILGNNMYGDNSADLPYIWFNTLNENSVELSLSIFAKNGDTYNRFDEVQTQYIHEQQDIITALNSAGFKNVAVTDGNGNEVTATTERLLFIAKK